MIIGLSSSTLGFMGRYSYFKEVLFLIRDQKMVENKEHIEEPGEIIEAKYIRSQWYFQSIFD